MANDFKNKEPLPTTETASLRPIVPPIDYPARDERWRKEKIESLRKRLVDPKYHVRMPGSLFTAEWRELIGSSGYQLLGTLIRLSDWKTRRWYGNIFALAEVLGLSDKTIRNQLNKLKMISGFRVIRHPWSITVELPERLYPQTKKSHHEQIIK